MIYLTQGNNIFRLSGITEVVQNDLKLDDRVSMCTSKQKFGEQTNLTWQEIAIKQMIMDFAFNIYDADCPYSIEHSKKDW